jgi:hypothetical protein
MKKLQNWRRATGIYLLWATAHLMIFLLNTPSEKFKAYIWPFYMGGVNESFFNTYDGTELMIYLVVAVVLTIALKLIFSKPTNQN